MVTRNLRAGVRMAINLRAELNPAGSELDFTVTPKQGPGAESISGDEWFPCKVLDISDHGFLLVCNKALEVGQIFDLRCRLYPEKLLECKIEIRHTHASGIGTKFVEIDAKNIALCQLFLQEYYSDKLNKSG